jgi:hypothetical protein
VSKTKVAVTGSGNIGTLNPALQPAHRTQVAVFLKVERADQPQPEGLPA